jgi:SAM-dependent methyltransferase
MSKKFKIQNNILVPSDTTNPKSLRMSRYICSFYNHSIKKYSMGKLLDLGCGMAPMYDFYEKYSTQITLLDWGNTFHNNSNIHISHDLNKPLPFEDNIFDTIIFSDVLEHLHNPKSIFSEMNRILKPDGVILLNFPFFYGLHEIPYDYSRYTKYFIHVITTDLDMEIKEEHEYGSLFDLFEYVILRIVPIKLLNLFSFLFSFYNGTKRKNNTYPSMYAYVLKKFKTK